MEKLPFDSKQFRKAKQTRLYEILRCGSVIAKTYAVSKEKALSNALYRFYMSGDFSYNEFRDDFEVREAAAK